MLVVALLGGVGLHAGITKILSFDRVFTAVGASVVVLFILIYSYINSQDLG
jgi:hypothetical protein